MNCFGSTWIVLKTYSTGRLLSSKYVIRLYKVKMVLWFHVTSKCDSVRKSDYDLVWLCV